MPQSIKELFPKLEVFEFLNEEDYDTLEQYMFRYQYDEGQYVFKEGAHGGYMFFIVQGEAEVTKLVKNQRVMVARVSRGRSLGEMSLLDGHTRSASVRALSELTLIVLKREEFNQLLDDHPSIANRVVMGIAGLLSSSLRRTTQEFSEQTLSLC